MTTTPTRPKARRLSPRMRSPSPMFPVESTASLLWGGRGPAAPRPRACNQRCPAPPPPPPPLPRRQANRPHAGALQLRRRVVEVVAGLGELRPAETFRVTVGEHHVADPVL